MTDSLSKFLGAGAGLNGGNVAQIQYMPANGTFTAAYDGVLDILLIGGHGSGALAHTNGSVTGAGAGEAAIKTVSVTKGTVFTVALGNGGAAVGPRTTAGLTQGLDGANSTVTGGGVNMTAIGGKGGKAGTSYPLLGGLGGTGGTGGDVHMPGGNGGDIANGLDAFATGSGGVNMKNLPAGSTRGGNISYSTGSGFRISGGGGVGGHGGDINLVGNASVQSGGGGYGGDGAVNDFTPVAANAIGANVGAAPAELVLLLASWGLNYFGGGGGPGGGGIGSTSASPSGVFGGPGGQYASGITLVGAPGNQGPGGSVAGTSGSTITSGKGANGYAVFILRRV